MKNKYTIDYAIKSHVGQVRLVNEDQVRLEVQKNGDVLMIVADGMGGHNKGDYASKIAADHLAGEFKARKFPFINSLHAKWWLENEIYKLNKLIYETQEQSDLYKGMGTTIVVALLHHSSLIVVNVGDSRAYTIKDFKLKRLSEDQSYVDYLRRSGQVSESDAEKRTDKNILMSAVGTYPSVNFNSYFYLFKEGSILLCSDGLYNSLKEDEIFLIIDKGFSAQETVDELVAKANLQGGSDNITVCYLKRKKA